MRGTFFKIVFLYVVLLFSMIGLQKLYDFALNENKNLKIAYVQKEHINADILIHGPCEPLWIVSPAILDKQTGLKSYNLALSHSDFADNYLHLYCYLKNNKAPKYMFLYVTPESMDPGYNTFNSYRFAPYLDDDTIKKVVSECDPDYYKWSFIPFMRYAYYSNKINFNAVQGLKHYFSKRARPYYPDGFEPPAKIKWDNHLERFIELYPNGYNFLWNRLREKYLRRTIELAQAKGIKVYLYESPVLNEAKRWQPNRAIMLKGISNLAKEYDTEYLIFDGMKIADSRKYFISTLNLSLEGAAIYTDSLGKYIKQNIIDKPLNP